MVKRNIFFIILLGIVLGVLSWYYYLHTHKDKYSFPGYDVENADFFGISAKGKAYNMKANYVKKISSKLYNLNTVYFKYYLDQARDKYTETISPTGVFDEEKNTLDLNGGVEFILSYGYRMLTENFFIDIDKHISHTKDEVLVSGTQGKIISKNGMTVYMKDKKITFHGPIKSMFIESEVTK
jgi:LPS export ABC transporter protein LptC